MISADIIDNNNKIDKQPPAMNPDEYEKFSMATIVTKNSKTGITSNKRVLVIRKGYLYYYSKVPENFKKDPKVLENNRDLPKCSIQILNIKRINGYQNNSNYFSIQFEAKHMMEQEDIRKTITLEEFNFAPKNTKQIITWQFTCDNQFIKQQWVSALQNLQSYYSKEKINIQKFFDNINKKEEEVNVGGFGGVINGSALAMRSSVRVPWREDQLKNSGSNENLRKNSRNSVVSNSRLSLNSSTNRSGDSPKKPSSELSSHSSQQKKKITNENIVENFIKLEKTISVEPPRNVIIEQIEQSSLLSPLVKLNNQTKSAQESGPLNKKKSSTVQLPSPSAQNNQQQQKSLFHMTSSNMIVSPSQDSLKTPFKRKQVEQPLKETSSDYQMQVPNETNPKSNSKPNYYISSHARSISSSTPPASTSNHPKMFLPKSPLKSPQPTLEYKVDSQTSFNELVFFSCHREFSFSKRMEAQKRLNLIIGQFTEKSLTKFIDFVSTKNSEQSHGNKYKQNKIGEDLYELEIGYITYKIGYVSTQSISINNKQRVYYNEQSIKSLKKQMKVYNKIFAKIIETIKQANTSSEVLSQTQHHKMKELRIPLCAYLEYKGICTLATSEQEQENGKEYEVSVHQHGLHEEWKEIFAYMGYNVNNFTFKTLQSRDKKKPTYTVACINSLKNIELAPIQKHHNIVFDTPLTIGFLKTAARANASTSAQSLLKYIKGISVMGTKESEDGYKLFTCPKSQILTVLKYCYLCKYLRKFYRAAQGEVNELHFIRLLLRGDEGLYSLFENAGFDLDACGAMNRGMKNEKVLGLFLDFLTYYLGISCQADYQLLNQYGNLHPIGVSQPTTLVPIIRQTKLLPKIHSLSLESLQLYESFCHIGTYLNNKSQLQLARKALEIKQQTYYDNPYNNNRHIENGNGYGRQLQAQILANTAELNYMENDYINAVNSSKKMLGHQQQDGIKYQPSCLIPIYLLMMKCYSKFSLEKYNELMVEMIETVICNYGQESTYLVMVFTFVGLTNNSMKGRDGVKFLLAAQGLSQKIYNNRNIDNWCYNPLKICELYLDIARVLSSEGQNKQAEEYLQKVSQIFKANPLGTHNSLVNLYLLNLQILLESPQSTENEEKILKIVYDLEKVRNMKNNANTNADIELIMYRIGRKYSRRQLCIQSIEQLWASNFNCKIMAIELCYKLITHKQSATSNQDNKCTLSQEKAVLMLEEEKRNGVDSGSGLLLDVVEDAFMEQDENVIGLILRCLEVDGRKSS